MNVQEAIQKAVKENKYIIRAEFEGHHKIDVSTGGPFIALNQNGTPVHKKGPCAWNPTYFDILAEDWLVVD